jgi:hypothetical protein
LTPSRFLAETAFSRVELSVVAAVGEEVKVLSDA